MAMTDFREMFACKSRNHVSHESRDYCSLGARGTVKVGSAEMYNLFHNSRCVCLCPTRPLFSSLWPLYNQAHDTVWPKWHHHRLLALTGVYNPIERLWKSIEILEYKNQGQCVVVTKMPDAILSALFQVTSFDFVQAASHESRIIIKRRGDGQINGAVYDLEKNTWGTEWRVPGNAVAWFRGIYPIQELLSPWEKYLTTCHTYVAPERPRVGKKPLIRPATAEALTYRSR